MTDKMNQKKIHIVYNCKEHDRIINPILEESPDKIYYFHHDGQNSDIYMEQYSNNISILREKRPNVEIIKDSVDYVDYYNIIAKLAEIISDNKKSKITINMGTGSKMVALANMDAYRLWNIEIIYPYSLNYDPTNESAHSGDIKSAELPKFEFRTPPPKLIRVMQVIYWLMTHDRYDHEKHNVRQKEIQEFYFDKFKVEQVPYNSNPRDYDSSQKIKLRRRLDQLVKDWGLIYFTKQGRANYIHFTEQGLRMIRVLMNYNYGLTLPATRE